MEKGGIKDIYNGSGVALWLVIEAESYCGGGGGVPVAGRLNVKCISF